MYPSIHLTVYLANCLSILHMVRVLLSVRGVCVCVFVCALNYCEAEPSRVHTCRTEVGAGGAPGAGGGACGGEEREGIRTQKGPYRQKGGDTSSGTQAHRKASVYIPLIPFFLASSCHVITLNSLITRPQTRLAPMLPSARDRPRFNLHSIRTESA